MLYLYSFSLIRVLTIPWEMDVLNAHPCGVRESMIEPVAQPTGANYYFPR